MSDEKTPPTASAWSELCWFVACPHCGETTDLGEGASWREGTEDSCEHCGEGFLLPEQENPNDLSRHCVRGAP